MHWPGYHSKAYSFAAGQKVSICPFEGSMCSREQIFNSRDGAQFIGDARLVAPLPATSGAQGALKGLPSCFDAQASRPFSCLLLASQWRAWEGHRALSVLGEFDRTRLTP